QLLPALRRLSTGRTTLIVSHDLQVAAIADRVLTLTAGTLTDSATPVAALASPRP
ncbi:MAG: hypothetical protein QOF98_2541, partial [Streptomyces sp.]|nr:hypothetical protein [Streptomyces sp.]